MKGIDESNTHKVLYALPCCDKLITNSPNEELENARIKVENMEASLLLLSGGSDANWPASQFSEQIMTRLDKVKYTFPYHHIRYEKAGHLIEPPYAPFCDMSYHKLMNGSIQWGGEGHHHNISQVSTLFHLPNIHYLIHSKGTFLEDYARFLSILIILPIQIIKYSPSKLSHIHSIIFIKIKHY